MSDRCPEINQCGATRYRGTDCKCYCKNDDYDPYNPAIECDPGK